MTETIDEGFWLPHTSSIDFCESNYGLSPNIVEFHNTWSSIAFLSLFGLVGLWKGNPTNEWRYTLGYLVLTMIGIGSAGLHGTLHWFFQSSDELPMIYLVTLMNFMAIEFESPHGQPKYPKLPLLLTVLMVVNTLVYYTFQHLYSVFITTYSVMSTYHVYLVYNLIFKTKKGGIVSRRLCQASQFSYMGIGFPLWIIDMVYCDWFHEKFSGNAYGMTFHVFWHFGAGFGAYLGLVSLENCRVMALGLPHRVEYFLGWIPYIKLIKKEAKAD